MRTGRTNSSGRSTSTARTATPPQRASAAQALSSVETVGSGGVYRVTAPLTAHLDAQVTAVANCLKPTLNTGGQTF